MRSPVRIIIAGLAVMLAGSVFVSRAPAQERRTHRILFFFSPSCSHCQKIEHELIPAIRKEFGDGIVIEAHDITDPEQYKKLLALRDARAKDASLNVPIMIVGRYWLSGSTAIEENLRRILREAPAQEDAASAEPVDLIQRFKNIRPLAIIGAGLADGINPCAFTVIVFFISFLAVQGYRRKELAFIGISFIAAVFLTYLLIGLGLFNFLYRLKGFWVLTRSLNAAVGVFSVVLGFLSLYDYLQFRRRGSAEGMILQLPQTVKNRIHAVIGRFYRLRGAEKAAVRPKPSYLAFSALATGFIVSLLEAVCTGQLYLPTIIYVFKTSELRPQAFRYLILYNLMFIVPLVAVFVLALLGMTSQQFSAFVRRRLGLTKLALAFVFFALGLLLLWRF